MIKLGKPWEKDRKEQEAVANAFVGESVVLILTL